MSFIIFLLKNDKAISKYQTTCNGSKIISNSIKSQVQLMYDL
jgi:hypothetical protein